MGRKKQNDEELTKKAILDYLQKNSLQIRMQYGLLDARLEENPARLVIVASSQIKELDNITHNDVKIPVEFEIQSIPAVIESEKPEDDSYYHEFPDEAKKIYNIKDTIGPGMKNKGKSKNSFEAWKKRHSSVKIGK